MRPRRMLWNLLAIGAGVYAGLCLVFLLFQRSFIYMPTPEIQKLVTGWMGPFYAGNEQPRQAARGRRTRGS